MIRDITIGQYMPGDSFLHKMDARAKIVLTFAYILAIFFCKNFWALGLMVLLSAVLVPVSRVPVRQVLRSLRPLIVILLFTAVLNLFYTKSGNTLWSWKFLTLTDKGLFTAIFMAVRILALVAVSSLLTFTTTPTDLTDGIERLLSPLKIVKVPVHSLAMMMTLALRFIPTLIEEIDRIMSAQKARGADLESGGFIRRAKALLPILIPLFVSAFRRAYDLAYAMECRCYRGGEGRTRLRQMRFGVRDGVALVLFVCVLAGVAVLNYFFKALI